jgi:hypothetical protein
MGWAGGAQAPPVRRAARSVACAAATTCARRSAPGIVFSTLGLTRASLLSGTADPFAAFAPQWIIPMARGSTSLPAARSNLPTRLPEDPQRRVPSTAPVLMDGSFLRSTETRPDNHSHWTSSPKPRAGALCSASTSDSARRDAMVPQRTEVDQSHWRTLVCRPRSLGSSPADPAAPVEKRSPRAQARRRLADFEQRRVQVAGDRAGRATSIPPAGDRPRTACGSTTVWPRRSEFSWST